MKRTAFFISDGTGITAEGLGKSLLSQFDGIEFERVTIPYVDSIEKAYQAKAQIRLKAHQDGARPIIFDTIVNSEVREVVASSNAFMADIFGTYLKPLEKEFQKESNYSVGKTHSILGDEHYMERIEAVHFALDNDDGARTRHYENADIIILGVSRCGKTPTCLYLGLQYGVRAANYPLTEDDIEDLILPKCLQPFRKKLFGLTIDTDRLAAIRNERRANSRYASPRQCEMEVRGVEALYAKEGIPCLNSTHSSIEEISSRLLSLSGMKRHLKRQLP